MDETWPVFLRLAHFSASNRLHCIFVMYPDLLIAGLISVIFMCLFLVWQNNRACGTDPPPPPSPSVSGIRFVNTQYIIIQIVRDVFDHICRPMFWFRLILKFINTTWRPYLIEIDHQTSCTCMLTRIKQMEDNQGRNLIRMRVHSSPSRIESPLYCAILADGFSIFAIYPG